MFEPLAVPTCRAKVQRRRACRAGLHVSRFTLRNPLSFKLVQPSSTLFNLIFYASHPRPDIWQPANQIKVNHGESR
jgi:hypothetical protein